MDKRREIELLLDLLFHQKRLGTLPLANKRQRERVSKELRKLRQLRRIPGVLAFGLGRRTRASQERREICLKVYVEQKIGSEILAQKQLLPRSIVLPWSRVEIGVDVEETGKIEPAAAPPTPGLPLQGGDSVFNALGSPGALGCLVADLGGTSAICILSCSHVIARSGLSSVGEAILWVGRPQGPPIASLSRFRPFDFRLNGRNIDAAIAAVANPTMFFPSVKGRRVTGVRARQQLVVGEPLSLFSAVSQAPVSGTLLDKNFFLPARFPVPPTGATSGVAIFSNQLLCSTPVQRGDSGSVILDAAGNIVGLIHSLAPNKGAVANPIDEVLPTLGIDVIRTPP